MNSKLGTVINDDVHQSGFGYSAAVWMCGMSRWKRQEKGRCGVVNANTIKSFFFLVNSHCKLMEDVGMKQRERERERERCYSLQHLLWSRAAKTHSEFLADMPLLLLNTSHVRETSSKVAFERFQKQNSGSLMTTDSELVSVGYPDTRKSRGCEGVYWNCSILLRIEYSWAKWGTRRFVRVKGRAHSQNEHTHSSNTRCQLFVSGGITVISTAER
jgi:hypothetical protein